MTCSLCKSLPEFKKFLIKKYHFWRVELRSNQNYLGWCFVVLNRHEEDLMDITKAEREELFDISRRLRNVLRDLFQPDQFNYASFGNETNHVHLQVIPRYSREVVFKKIVFKDLNWGKNYKPYDKNWDVSKEVKIAIKNAIQEKL